ncbi:YdaE family protein [Raoultella planticola]|uniref:YdaE family protein n=1 Tax=Raoultella planticola TaxID=575 RepID=UPI001186FA4E|nr:YdaE family protein [Raoultella planticola]
MGPKIKCSYRLCNKEIDEKDSVEKPLHFMHGVRFTTELKKYCCEQCAVYDQMAHEL